MIYVIGVGLKGRSSLAVEARNIIKGSGLLAGGKRHLEEFPGFSGLRVEIGADLEAVARAIRGYLKGRGAGKNVAVLATGDPLLFGIAEFIVKRFGNPAVTVIPNVSTVTEAFARIKIPSGGVKVLSAHGKGDMAGAVVDEVMANEKTAIFTDPENNPARIAAALEGAGADYSAYLCQSLGSSDERVERLTLGALARRKKFSPLNILILTRNAGAGRSAGAGSVPPFGIPDEAFIRASNTITKEEVRVVSLSKLNVRRDSVVWDIGAGSGTVSIEAARLAPSGRVYAVEKDGKRAKCIGRNSRRFNTTNLTVINGVAPGCVVGAKLPAPDAIFVGGGGPEIKKILGCCARALKKGGRMVVNAVTIETLSAATDFFKKTEWDSGCVQISSARSRKVAGLTMLGAQNPVFILWAEKRR